MRATHTNRFKGAFRLAVGLACAVAWAIPALADNKITIVVGGIEKQIYAPAKLTERLGYFTEQGLDVDLITDQSGVDAEDQLLAGAVQGVIGFYDHCVDLQSKGKFVRSVVQFSLTPGEVELVSNKHPEIKSPADFGGRSLGVTGLGSSTNFLTQFLAVKHGLKLGEFTSIPVGSGESFITAMQQDTIQAGMTTEPTISRMVSSGAARIMVDLRTVEATKAELGGTYPAVSLYMETRWIEQHPDIVQKLANAFVKSLRYIASHSAAEIADHMPNEYFAGNKAAYIAALDTSRAMFTTDGVMPPDGPETVYSVLAGFSKNVRGKKIDLSKTFTTEFVKAAK